MTIGDPGKELRAGVRLTEGGGLIIEFEAPTPKTESELKKIISWARERRTGLREAHFYASFTRTDSGLKLLLRKPLYKIL